MGPTRSGKPSDAGRRRVLAMIGRLLLGGSVGSVVRTSLGGVVGGGIARLAVVPDAVPAAGTAPPAIVASGPGPTVGGGTMLRGCSATATAVEGWGGRLPSGISIDFGRRTALLLTGLDPTRLEIDEGTGDVAGPAAPAWILVAVHGRARDLVPNWRIRAAGRTTVVASETTGG
jgi:hypothetical protein